MPSTGASASALPSSASSVTPTPSPQTYIGRFAPSPTGPLHFGSLVSALGSYLHAREHRGRWLVRMEDIDPPREQPGAADDIRRSLEAHGLHWDGELLYQRQRLDAYAAVLESLQARGLVYACDCTRQDLHAMGGIYNGHCRNRALAANQAYALRLKLYNTPEYPGELLTFADLFQGEQQQNLRLAVGDPILKRKDGLFAYQLAVVVDDLFQGITHVIRGQDLLAVTARQIALFKLLGNAPPVYGHLPLALNPQGQKLSKQNLAPALIPERAGNNLWQALGFLGQNPPAELAEASASEVLAWASAHWSSQTLTSLSSHLAPPTYCG